MTLTYIIGIRLFPIMVSVYPKQDSLDDNVPVSFYYHLDYIVACR